MLFPKSCDPTQGICHSLGGKQLERFAGAVMLGCWKLSQQPSTHPGMTLPPSSISFYLLLMPGLACQGCGFCSTTAAKLGQPGLPAQPARAFLAGLHFLPLSTTEAASQAAPDTNCFSSLCYSFSSHYWVSAIEVALQSPETSSVFWHSFCTAMGSPSVSLSDVDVMN